MTQKTMEQQYKEGRRYMWEKIREFIWEDVAPNGNGPWSEGQFDAAQEIVEAINFKLKNNGTNSP